MIAIPTKTQKNLVSIIVLCIFFLVWFVTLFCLLDKASLVQLIIYNIVMTTLLVFSVLDFFKRN